MLTTVKLIGTGKDGDAYRVSLPTYSLILANITEKTALIHLPDDVHGLSEDDLKHETQHETSRGALYPKLCKECVDKIHAHLDETYQEHKGEFRLEQV